MLAWILLFPLIGFLINGLWYAFGQAPEGRQKAGVLPTGIVASSAIFLSFCTAVYSFMQLYGMEPGTRVIEQMIFPWITVGSFQIDLALRLDELNALFCLVITGVGTLIHLYSMGYMDHDEAPGKYFAYLNLFCFAMLTLVLGASLPVLFLGWEGVGLCSYLLIGFWYKDNEKASAGKKAFVVNRIGDLGFILGMFVIFTLFGTLDFAAIQAAVDTAVQSGGASNPFDETQMGLITLACLLLFIGCTGKSAQIPLYVWLPDAMAGPTPVSALIHAATMVTSGIYLIARLNFMYTLSPVALEVVAWVGALTALAAATMAITQTDIKKVLAYSTVSQLGYMFLGCGVAAYGAGVFHVITHAFFKALLFLGAGSVIYGMHHEQDICKMGAVRKKMPRTFIVFLIAWLAISGIPPFSGFFSKDEILWYTFKSTHGSALFLWIIGMITAAMTAFYMTRLFYLTFMGEKQRSDIKVHESPAIMTVPLMILAVLSAVGGFMGIPHMSWLGHWLDPVVPHSVVIAGHELRNVNPNLEWVLMGVSVAIATAGILFAWKFYQDLSKPEKAMKQYNGLYKFLNNKWYVDELYEATFVKPIVSFSRALWRGFDVAVIDRVVLGFGRAASWTGQTIRVLQTGSLQTYVIALLIGLFFTLGYMIYGLAY